MVPRDCLEGLRFTQGLPADQLDKLAALAEIKDLPPNTFVFREGDRSPFVYIVLSGKVALEIRVPGRGTIPIHTVGDGELLGWSPLLSQGPMTTNAKTVGPCKLLALNAVQLRAQAEHDPRLGMEMMRRTAAALAQRLSATRLQLLDVFRHEFQATPEEGGRA